MMRQASRFLSVTIVVLLAGCKLAVIVVEGGEVQSDRSGSCAAGSVCVVVVEDTSFSDFFEPVPYDSWYFDSWHSGNRFLCGGSIDPGCALSFSGYEDKVEGIVASSETFYLMPVFKPIEPNSIAVEGESVIAANKVWLQPADFLSYSHEQVSQVCPKKGVCSGTLPGSSVDLTGYIWASSDDIRVLFQAYRRADRSLVGDFENTWVAEFPSGSSPSLNAILRDQYVVVILGDAPGSGGEFLRTEDAPYPPNITGVWFWRNFE